VVIKFTARHWPLLLVLITSLGDRLVNRLARKIDPRFLAPHYFARLSNQIVDAFKCDAYHLPVSNKVISVDWDRAVVINTWSQLFGKLSTLGHAGKFISVNEHIRITLPTDTLISHLVEWLMSPECQSVTWKPRLAKIIEHVPDNQVENLIASLIQRSSLYSYNSGTRSI